MRSNCVPMLSVLLSFLIFFGSSLASARELIPPTRTLGEAEKPYGKLVVFSEPPELEVYLDGTMVGETPLWLDDVEAGVHQVRIKDTETEIYLGTGTKLKVGLFEGSVLAFPEREEIELPAPPEERPPGEARVKKMPEEEREKDLTRWERFINGTLPFF